MFLSHMITYNICFEFHTYIPLHLNKNLRPLMKINYVYRATLKVFGQCVVIITSLFPVMILILFSPEGRGRLNTFRFTFRSLSEASTLLCTCVYSCCNMSQNLRKMFAFQSGTFPAILTSTCDVWNVNIFFPTKPFYWVSFASSISVICY